MKDTATPLRLHSNALVAFPLVATQSACYDQVEDAEGGLICFVAMGDNSREVCAHIARVLNAHHERQADSD